MTDVHGPTAGRRKLRVALRAARESAALTQESVAEAMDWSLSKLIRIEAGRVGVSTNDVRALLGLYGVADTDQEGQLIQLARLARQKPWWHEHRDALTQLSAQFVGLESEAAGIRCYQRMVIPELLQTEAYARAVLAAGPPGRLRPEAIEAQVRVRVLRQREVLGRAGSPATRVVLDEAVLRRSPGGPEVLREQLAHLLRLHDDVDLRIQVVPFDVPAEPSAAAYCILEFPDPADNDVLYLEGAAVEQLIDRPEDTARFRAEFDWLASVALSPAESLALIGR